MAEFTPLDGAGTGSSAARRSPAAHGREPEVSENHRGLGAIRARAV